MVERLVRTPSGNKMFDVATLDEKGYHWKLMGEDKRLVEIVYVRVDGSTGTIIADLDSLFDLRMVVEDGRPVCEVIFKFLSEVTSPVTLHRARVRLQKIDGDILSKIAGQLLDSFLSGMFGKPGDIEEVEEDDKEETPPTG